MSKGRIQSPPADYLEKDTGCQLAPACLSCPLPQCVHDMTPREARRARRQAGLRPREAQAAETTARILAMWDEGLSAKRIAMDLGVTPLTVSRRLQARPIPQETAAAAVSRPSKEHVMPPPRVSGRTGDSQS